jgi:CheY-specific phosphatase CheX
MDNELQEAAVGAISHVFETMFFVFLEPYSPDSGDPPPGHWSPNEQWLEGRLGFQGTLRGYLRLFLPFPLARDLATNFLGLEEEASEQQVIDMTKELTNMICGNLFSRYDQVQGYALTIPQAEIIRFGESAGPGPSPEGLRLDFLAEDQMIRLEIQLGE